MKLNLHWVITPLIWLAFTLQSIAGEDLTVSPQNYNHYYRQGSVALTSPVYRDFATSPLFYRGSGIAFSSSWLRRSLHRERLFSMGLELGAVSAFAPEGEFIRPLSVGMFHQLSLYYHQLWRLEALSDHRNNVKLGGALYTSQHIRSNPSLLNNALGLENLTHLMASAQLTRDISRTEPRKGYFFLFSTMLKPVKRDLRFQTNVGLLNFNYRPGYAYSYDAELVGLETSPLSWVLADYRWSLNGWRISTQIEYISYLPNGNARSIAYVWEAAHAPGRHEAFQMASHRIQYTMFFHTAKR